jgi:peptidoglycan/LPS O-acetylase OafA/YrhL
VASYFYIGGLADPWYYRFAPSEMMLFGLGALSYHAHARLRWSAATQKRVGAGALLVAIVLVGFRGLLGPARAALHIAIAPLMLWDPVLLGVMVLSAPVIFALTRAHRLDRFLGDLSYPFYLSHVAVAAALSGWAAPNAGLGSVVYVGTTFAVSIALLVLIDRPLTKLRARRFGAQSHRRKTADEAA